MEKQLLNSLESLKNKNLINNYELKDGTISITCSEELIKMTKSLPNCNVKGRSIEYTDFTQYALRLCNLIIEHMDDDEENYENESVTLSLSYVISYIKTGENNIGYELIEWNFETKSFLESVLREVERFMGLHISYEFLQGEDYLLEDRVQFLKVENKVNEDALFQISLNRREVVALSEQAIKECHEKKPSLFKKNKKNNIYKDTESLIIDKLFKNQKEVTLTKETLYLAFYEVVNTTVYGYMTEDASEYIELFKNGFPEAFYDGDKKLLKEKAYRFDYLYVLANKIKENWL